LTIPESWIDASLPASAPLLEAEEELAPELALEVDWALDEELLPWPPSLPRTLVTHTWNVVVEPMSVAVAQAAPPGHA